LSSTFTKTTPTSGVAGIQEVKPEEKKSEK
jgi:hypothetical protein